VGIMKAEESDIFKGWIHLYCFDIPLAVHLFHETSQLLLKFLEEEAQKRKALGIYVTPAHPFYKGFDSEVLFFAQNNYIPQGLLWVKEFKENSLKGIPSHKHLSLFLSEEKFCELFQEKIGVHSHPTCPWVSHGLKHTLDMVSEIFPKMPVYEVSFPIGFPKSTVRERVWIYGIPLFYTFFEKDLLEKEIMNVKEMINSYSFKVWQVVFKIPKGYWSSCEDIAKYMKIGNSQSVLQALYENIFSPFVPCHRVLNEDGSLGKCYQESEREIFIKKEKILREEGILFDQEGKAHIKQKICFCE